MPKSLPAPGVDPTALRQRWRGAPSTLRTKRNRSPGEERSTHNQTSDRNPNSRSIKSSEVQKGGIYPQIRETRAYRLGNVAKPGNPLLRSPQRRLNLVQRQCCLRGPRGAAQHPSGSERLEPPGRRLVLRRGWRGNPEQARVGGALGRWCSVTVCLADLFRRHCIAALLAGLHRRRPALERGSQLAPAAPAGRDQARKQNSRR